jgi:hypothetical protein
MATLRQQPSRDTAKSGRPGVRGPCEVGKTGAELVRNTPVRLVQDAVCTRCPRSRSSPACAKSRFSFQAGGQGPSSVYRVGTRGSC